MLGAWIIKAAPPSEMVPLESISIELFAVTLAPSLTVEPAAVFAVRMIALPVMAPVVAMLPPVALTVKVEAAPELPPVKVTVPAAVSST